MKDNNINIETLRKRTVERKVPAYHYCIGNYKDMALCIVEENGRWHVFEYDHGRKFSERIFDVEADACIYFWNTLLTYL